MSLRIAGFLARNRVAPAFVGACISSFFNHLSQVRGATLFSGGTVARRSTYCGLSIQGHVGT